MLNSTHLLVFDEILCEAAITAQDIGNSWNAVGTFKTCKQ